MIKPFMEFDLEDFSNTNIENKSLAEIRRDNFTEGFTKGKQDAYQEIKELMKEYVDYESIDKFVEALRKLSGFEECSRFEECSKEAYEQAKEKSIRDFLSWLEETKKINLQVWKTLDNFADEYLGN